MDAVVKPATIMVTMTHAVRFFRVVDSQVQLYRTDRIVIEGSKIRIWPPEQKVYDHRIQLAVPCVYLSRPGYILLEEIRDPFLKERMSLLRRFSIAA
ncbi:MAG: hypothetical protein KA731_00355 [Candidatus Moranbacteria bacterium]|nr:hypothetical protein [Candidatus Moranbacteria bacterium]MBP6033869.1 hypothetical protein [Candidatus Moranbacteria bacterium]MBP7695673.1 hypothetical protein [Candidatus Moranbacteria bacterium]